MSKGVMPSLSIMMYESLTVPYGWCSASRGATATGDLALGRPSGYVERGLAYPAEANEMATTEMKRREEDMMAGEEVGRHSACAALITLTGKCLSLFDFCGVPQKG